jgi:hypothetical protein
MSNKLESEVEVTSYQLYANELGNRCVDLVISIAGGKKCTVTFTLEPCHDLAEGAFLFKGCNIAETLNSVDRYNYNTLQSLGRILLGMPTRLINLNPL